jgi:hypothetical protein
MVWLCIVLGMEVRVNSNVSGPGILDGEQHRYVMVDTSFVAELGDGLTVTGRLAADPSAGVLGFGPVNLTAPGPITPTMVRSVKWGDMLDQVIDRATVKAEVHDGGFTLLPLGPQPEGASVRRRKSGGRRRLDDDHYRQVAAVYRRAMNDGDPVIAVQVDLGAKSRATAARWVGEARKRGFLGPAPAPGAKGEKS